MFNRKFPKASLENILTLLVDRHQIWTAPIHRSFEIAGIALGADYSLAAGR